MSEMTTDDLQAELERRQASKKKRGEHVRRHGFSVSALVIAALGAYQGYADKESAQIAAQLAAEAKVDGHMDREDWVGAVNELRQENAVLRAELLAHKEQEKERYEGLRDWMRNVGRRTGSAPIPAVVEQAAEESLPEPPAPKVDLLKTERPNKKGDDYLEQVQQLLQQKGLK